MPGQRTGGAAGPPAGVFEKDEFKTGLVKAAGLRSPKRVGHVAAPVVVLLETQHLADFAVRQQAFLWGNRAAEAHFGKVTLQQLGIRLADRVGVIAGVENLMPRPSLCNARSTICPRSRASI